MLTRESKHSRFNKKLANLQPETVDTESQDILKSFQCCGEISICVWEHWQRLGSTENKDQTPKDSLWINNLKGSMIVKSIQAPCWELLSFPRASVLETWTSACFTLLISTPRTPTCWQSSISWLTKTNAKQHPGTFCSGIVKLGGKTTQHRFTSQISHHYHHHHHHFRARLLIESNIST